MAAGILRRHIPLPAADVDLAENCRQALIRLIPPRAESLNPSLRSTTEIGADWQPLEELPAPNVPLIAIGWRAGNRDFDFRRMLLPCSRFESDRRSRLSSLLEHWASPSARAWSHPTAGCCQARVPTVRTTTGRRRLWPRFLRKRKSGNYS